MKSIKSLFSNDPAGTPGGKSVPNHSARSEHDARPEARRARLWPFLFLLLVLLLALFFLRPFFRQGRQSPDEAFQAFTRELFLANVSSSTLSLHYTLADPEAAGIEETPISFGSYSREEKERSASALENALEALSDFPQDELSASNRLTWDILCTQLQNELALAAYPYYEEALSPLLGIQAQLPTLLAEYSFASREDIDTYLALLEQTENYFESLLAYEQEKAAAGLFMSPETADAVIAQCRDFISRPGEHFLLSSFEERLSQADFLSSEEKAAYAQSNRARVIGHVLPAYELLIDGLEKLRDSGVNPYGLCHYPEGAAYYEDLVECTVAPGAA